MRCIYLISIFCCFSYSVFSQTEQLKSKVTGLQIQIKNAKKEEKLLLLDSLCRLIVEQPEFGYERITEQTIRLALELDSINIAAKHTSMLIHFLTNRLERPEDGLRLYESLMSKNLHITDSAVIAQLYYKGANSYFYTGQEQQALDLYEQTKKMALSLNDSTLYGRSMVSKAFAMSEMGKFSDASQEYQKALAVFNTQKDTFRILPAKVGLSILYGKNAFHKESLKELAFVLEIARGSENYSLIIVALNNTAVNHYFSKEYSKAIEAIKEAIALSEQHPLQTSGITSAYETLANCYSKLDSLELARQVIKKIEYRLKINPDKSVQMNFLKAKTNLLFAEKKYKLADSLGRQLLQLQQSTSNYEEVLSTTEVLFKANKALGKQNRELYYFKEHTRIKDSINSVIKVNALSYYQTLYETEKRDAQIAGQVAAIDLLSVQNKIQFQWMLLIVLTLFSIAAYFYFRSKRNKEKAKLEKSKKELIEQKNKAVNLENALLNKEIEYKKKDLINFAVEITQNQQWAKILYGKFENIKNAEDKEQAIEYLGIEIRDKLGVDLEAVEFHKKIEKLGSSFYDKLNERIPNLSKTELRLCALIRMKVETKQIAMLQNISPSSVRTSRYRLRKKFKLDSNQDLDAFIMGI